MLSACDPDRPVADGPVGQSFILGPVGTRRMFSLNELNQPVAVGPVDQPLQLARWAPMRGNLTANRWIE